MGYYASITGHSLRITDPAKAAKLANAAGFDGDTLDDVLHALGYEDGIALDEHGNVTDLYFSDKYRDDEVLWRALAPAIADHTQEAGPAFIEWRGEEDDHWRFVFENGAMTEVGCDVVWPYLNQQRTSPATVQPLTMGEESKGLLATTIEAHIDYLEALQRNGRDWYEDRYRYEGSPHPAYPSNIDALIREAKMTLKSVKDAERVVIDVEVLT